MNGIDELEPVFWEYEEEKIDVTKLFIYEACKVIIILKFGLYLDYSLSYAPPSVLILSMLTLAQQQELCFQIGNYFYLDSR